jgi:hypothetical protein
MNFREVPERKKNEHATGHFDSGEYPCIGRSGCPQPEKERQALQLRLLRLRHGRKMREGYKGGRKA